MLKINLICLGKIKEPYFRQAMTEYEKRLKPYCRFQCVEIPEERLPDEPSGAQIAAALEKEADRLLPKAPGMVVPLCVEGRQLDSPGLAQILETGMQYPGEISFVIGSSFGLSDRVKQAGQGISLSRMTFPHTLARVLLTEQIYRATQILAHTKYHK